jgi:hypothetical protein
MIRSKEQIEFIIEALEEAIGWAEYADDYFKEKHNLKRDQENVQKSISMLREALEVNTKDTKSCEWKQNEYDKAWQNPQCLGDSTLVLNDDFKFCPYCSGEIA